MRRRSRPVGMMAAAALACAAVACRPAPPASGPGAAAVPPAGGGGVVGVSPDVATTPGATTTVVRYGPYEVPAATGTGHGQEAMLGQVLADVAQPCGDCWLTGMRTTLRYADGREANIDTGQWLHHAIFASWPHADATCATNVLGLLGERFFATGNERSRARFPAGFGYRVSPGDRWQLSLDLMNATLAPTTLVVETAFEWVPAATPGMTPLRPVWIDANRCLDSGLPAGTGAYSYHTDWVVNRPGRVIGVGAHLHDGGTHLTLTNASTGELICNAVAGYGGPGYAEPAGGHDDHGGRAMEHVSSITECVAPTGDDPVTVLTAGHRVHMAVYYDTDRHAQQGDHPVMGVALVYVAGG